MLPAPERSVSEPSASQDPTPVPQVADEPKPSRGRHVEFGAVTAFGAALLAIVHAIRPLPFSSTDDAILHQGPIIKLQTDAALEGSLPRMFWELGSGWTPFESGQAGVFYPLYHFANIVSRLLGRPLALLDVSAAIHLWLAGAICVGLLPRTMSRNERIAWACLAMAQPAPFLLGLNWHSYLSPYPWFLAIALIVLRNASSAAWPKLDRFLLLGASTLFFLCVHPQMYVLSLLALGAWAFVVPGRRLASLGALACAQVPFVLPTLYLRSLGEAASSTWLTGRTTAEFILFESQSLGTALYGLLTGNLLGDGGFRLWEGVPWTGQGIFFAPWVVWSLALAFIHRRIGWIVVTTAFVLVMGITSVPWLAELLAGPLGFRWTWKLTAIFSPLALLTVVAFTQARPQPIVRTSAAYGLALLSAIVCIRGIGFDIFPSAISAHSIGIEGIASDTKAALSEAGVKPGSRIALIGRHPIFAQVPIPIVGLTGNAPVLAGYESAHLFEPLENAEAAASHYGLSTPWRGGIAAQTYRENPRGVEESLLRIGVDTLVSNVPNLFPADGSTATTDRLGRVTYVRRLQAEPFPRPWDVAPGFPHRLERLPGGKVRTLEPRETEPVLDPPRPISWQRLGDGRWEGTPIVLGESGELWVLATLLGALGATWLMLRLPLRRSEASTMQAKPPMPSASPKTPPTDSTAPDASNSRDELGFPWARLGRVAVVALVALFVGVHVAAIFREAANWDELPLLARATQSIHSGKLVGGGRPGLATLLLIPVVEGCRNSIDALMDARVLWAAFTFAYLGGIYVVVSRFDRSGRWSRAGFLALGLLALVPLFQRWSLQVRTDQPALAFSIWGGVALLASRRRPLFALLGGVLFAIAFLFTQKAAYVIALCCLLAAGAVWVERDLRLKRDAVRIAFVGLGGVAAYLLYYALLSPYLETASASVGALKRAMSFGRELGWSMVANWPPLLIPHILLTVLMAIATVHVVLRRSDGLRQLVLAWAVLGLGVVVLFVHDSRYAYFWMTIGAFPAIAIAIASGPMLSLVRARTGSLVLLLAGGLLVMRAVPTVDEILTNTVGIQRRSLDFVNRNFPPDARGYHPEHALQCREVPAPFAGRDWATRAKNYFFNEEGEKNTQRFIDEHRKRPVTFLIESRWLPAYPRAVFDFWATRYVPYADAVSVAGRFLAGPAGTKIPFEAVAAGEYALHLPEGHPRARIAIGNHVIPGSGKVWLSAGVHEIEILDPIEAGMLAWSLPEPPRPESLGRFYNMATVPEVAGARTWELMP